MQSFHTRKKEYRGPYSAGERVVNILVIGETSKIVSDKINRILDWWEGEAHWKQQK